MHVRGRGNQAWWVVTNASNDNGLCIEEVDHMIDSRVLFSIVFAVAAHYQRNTERVYMDVSIQFNFIYSVKSLGGGGGGREKYLTTEI